MKIVELIVGACQMKTVEFIVEACQDDTKVRGNVMCSGDDDYDKKCENEIIADLDDGNIWVWASVKVSARIQSIECSDYLGCCCYKDEADFREDSYYLDMKDTVLSDLRRDCESSMNAIERAEKELIAERKAYDKRMSLTELWRCPHCKDVVAVDPGYDDVPFCSICDTQRNRFDPVDVVFLRDIGDGDVFAVFPSEAAIVGNPNLVTCFANAGQHSSADLGYCAECEEITEPSKYADLIIELDRIGYNFRVVRKDCMNDPKYAISRLEQLRM